MSKTSWPILYCNLIYKMGQHFLYTFFQKTYISRGATCSNQVNMGIVFFLKVRKMCYSQGWLYTDPD